MKTITTIDRRRSLLRASLAFGSWLVLPPARACEFYAPGFTIVHPWTRASDEGAASAIVSLRFIDVRRADRLIGAQTPVAERVAMWVDGSLSELDLAINEAQTTTLGETGAQMRLIGLQGPLRAGREYPLLLHFENAGPVPARLSVDYARFG